MFVPTSTGHYARVAVPASASIATAPREHTFSAMNNPKCLLIYALLAKIIICHAFNIAEIENQREEIIRKEELLTVGGNTVLTAKEEAVNECIMKHKFQELDFAFNNPNYYNFSHHFFEYKPKIKFSKVYEIIKAMPKGAVLHVHDSSILGPDYLMEITYKPNLYICCNDFQLRFASSLENLPNSCSCSWELLSDVRSKTKNVTQLNQKLRSKFTMVVNKPDEVYKSIDDTWNAFMRYFAIVEPMLTFRPVWEEYFYDALKLFREHKVMYVEVRSILPPLYELDGKHFSPIVTAKSYQKVIKRFKKDYPDFLGAKLIYAPIRKVERETLDTYLELSRQIKKEIPDIFAGFDLVGQEDKGNPLIAFAPQLSKAAGEFNYFFHAGETNWYGTSSDINILDAVLLGTKRIGHGFALIKHPLYIKEVLNRDIGIEVNVISNTVLSLVRDVRNHPLSTFLAQGLPVTISSDDPGAWEADPISMDMYVAFVGAASRFSDLRLLKTLAINSLKYSAMEEMEKQDAINKFEVQWKVFIDNFHCIMY